MAIWVERRMIDIRIGIIGIGRIYSKHKEAIIQNGLLNNVVSICDIDENKLEKARVEFPNARCYTDYKKHNGYGDINLAIILTPHKPHFEISRYFLSKGINVLCEKPVVFESKQMEQLIDIASRNNVRLFQNFQNRYNKSVVQAKRAIKENRLGKILYVDVNCLWSRNMSYFNRDEWRGTKINRDGILYNQAIHHIDLLTYLLNPTNIKVYSNIRDKGNINTEEYQSEFALLKLDNYVCTMRLTNNCFRTNIESGILIVGTHGQIKIGGMAANKIDLWEFSEVRDDDSWIKGLETNPTNVYGFGHKELYKDMLQTWGTNKKTLVEENMFKPYIIAENIWNSWIGDE